MYFIPVGSMIERARKERKNVTRKKLCEGICTEQTLFAIEANQYETDTLLIDILLQRLGKSPDKLEIVLSQEAYRLVRLRDLIEEAVLRGRKKLANMVLESYPAQNSVNQMYRKRMQACILYRMDRDYEHAAALLQQTVALTLPCFSYETIEDYLISTIEMENLLALERVQLEDVSRKDKQQNIRHLEQCMEYITKHFKDEEENAKICSKCAWLLARAYFEQGETTRAMALCEKGIDGLRKHTMIYFMLPLLELMVQIGNRLGIAPERNKYVKYHESLRFLWDSFARKWYPADMLFHNCCQKEYHLDYELIKSERTAQHMNQETLIDGIYQNAASLSRLENAKASPNRKTFEKLMKKLGLEKGRYNGFVATTSFETMELRHQLDIAQAHDEYEKAEKILGQLRTRLNTKITENQRVLEDAEIQIQKNLHKISAEHALERQKTLLESLLDSDRKELRHIPMRNEVLIINHYCGTLSQMGHKNEAIALYLHALEKMRKSHINIKYRYRSFSLLLCNYVYECRDITAAYETLRNELSCGKASVLPFSLIDLLHIWDRDGKPERECMKLSEYIYYISDLFHFSKDKRKYADFLEKKKVTIIN